MADRIEREINEILAGLDELPDEPATERAPISIAEHRDRRSAEPRKPKPGMKPPRLNATAALLTGAGTVIGGLVLSMIWAPLVWAAFGGVVVFLGGFVAALLQRPKPANQEPPGGHFWRDRYIQYKQPEQSGNSWTRLRNRFRR